MPPPLTLDQCRDKVREMIGEAVAENDDGRREGLLALADQWNAILRRRSGHQKPDTVPDRCN